MTNTQPTTPAPSSEPVEVYRTYRRHSLRQLPAPNPEVVDQVAQLIGDDTRTRTNTSTDTLPPAETVEATLTRPEYVNGRKVALHALDTVLARRANQLRLVDAFQERFDQDPVKFFEDFAMPLMPRQLAVDTGDQGRAQLQIVITPSTDNDH